jgi:hypothetical protein
MGNLLGEERDREIACGKKIFLLNKNVHNMHTTRYVDEIDHT